MIHHRQGLPLGLEPSENLFGVHAGLDELDGDFAFDGTLLLCHPDRAHAALADVFEEFVATADDHAGGGVGVGADDGRGVGGIWIQRSSPLTPALSPTVTIMGGTESVAGEGAEQRHDERGRGR